MKKSLLFLLLLFPLGLAHLRAQLVTIPDPNLVTWLQTNYPSCMSGNQMDTTCSGILNATNVDLSNKSLTDATGLQYFDNLALLTLTTNQLTSLPPLPSTLVTLRCDNNPITVLPALPPNMYMLVASSTALTTLPTLPTTLKKLFVGMNPNLTFPPLPAGLEELDIQACNLSAVPPLPTGLKLLFVANDPLGVLPPLPPTLEALAFSNIGLTAFPSSLPATLTSLSFGAGDSVGTMPMPLPPGLTSLYCANAQMTALPAFPPTLHDLHCQNNLITSLPSLPASLVLLECHNNQLTSLPAIPPLMEIVNANDNQITSVGPLPNSLYNLGVDNNQVSCFAPFPQGTFLNVTALNNPFTCVPNYPNWMNPTIGSVPICTVGNTNGCPTGTGVGGTVYDDTNADCILNGVDPAVANVTVQTYDGSGTLVAASGTSTAGAYFHTLGMNTWTVKVDTAGKPFRVTCTNPGADTTVAMSVPLVQGINFEVDCKPGFDVGTVAVGIQGLLFPGQPFSTRILAGDIAQQYAMNCAAGVSGQVVVQVSGPATYVGPSPGALTPSVSGNTYTYNISDYGTVSLLTDFGLEFMMLTTATTSDTICVDVTVTPSSGDRDPLNNSYTHCQPVRNSLDPNAKDVYPTSVEPGYQEWLQYTLHFQNTGNAPAFNIRLVDTLEADLDLATLEVVSGSHYHTWELVGNVLTIYFPNILLPDSLSDPQGSQGWALLRVRPVAGLPEGTTIENSAAIYFDFNAPVITNTAVTRYEVANGVRDALRDLVIGVHPNPSDGLFTATLPQGWGRAEWRVTNVLGQSMATGTAAGEVSVDLGDAPAGMYLLEVRSGNRRATARLQRN